MKHNKTTSAEKGLSLALFCYFPKKPRRKLRVKLSQCCSAETPEKGKGCGWSATFFLFMEFVRYEIEYTMEGGLQSTVRQSVETSAP